MAKITMHIQPSQFEFIGFEYEEIEGLSDATIERAINDFTHSKAMIKGGEGMSEKEMDAWVQNMCLGAGNNADTYSKATPNQRTELHRIKRALNRIDAKQK